MIHNSVKEYLIIINYKYKNMAKRQKTVSVETPDVGIVDLNEETFKRLQNADPRYKLASGTRTPKEATSPIIRVNSSGETIDTGHTSPSGNILTRTTTYDPSTEVIGDTNPTTETPTGNTGETAKKE